MKRSTTRRLKKELGLFDVFAISVGVFSSGFFLLPGLAAQQAGPSVVLAYLLAAILILPALLSKAELATAMPRAGGTYYFIDRSMGSLFGTVGGLGMWLALVLKNAFALIGMGAYLRLWVPELTIEPIALGFTVAFGAFNIFGARSTAGLQKLLVVVLLLILGGFVLDGLLVVASEHGDRVGPRFEPFLTHGIDGLVATIGLVSVSYAGLSKVASVAEEVRTPDRTIPLGMLLSLLVATAIYVLGVFVMLVLEEPAMFHQDLSPVATVGAVLFDWMPGGAGVTLIVIGAVAAFASTANAGIMSASRFLLAMGRDGVVPARFAHIGRFHTPVLAVVVTCAAVALAIVSLDILSVAKLASAFLLIVFALVNLGVIVMRESGLDSYDPGFRSPLYPHLQIIGMLAPFVLIAEMGLMTILFTFGLIGLCTAWYFAFVQPRNARAGALFHWFARLGRQRNPLLDRELRTILNEKGLRDEDPFDETIARAMVLNVGRDATFDDVARQAAGLLARNVPLPPEELAGGFLHGTRTGATPVDYGAALPHLRVPGVEVPEIVLVRSLAGLHIDLGERPAASTNPGQRVHALFFLVTGEEDPAGHLRLLAQIAGRVDDEDFMDAWMSAGTDHELKETMLRRDRFVTVTLGLHPGAAPLVGRTVDEVDLPERAVLALMSRDGDTVAPAGDVELREGDRLTVVGIPDAIAPLKARWLHPEGAAGAASRRTS